MRMAASHVKESWRGKSIAPSSPPGRPGFLGRNGKPGLSTGAVVPHILAQAKGNGPESTFSWHRKVGTALLAIAGRRVTMTRYAKPRVTAEEVGCRAAG